MIGIWSGWQETRTGDRPRVSEPYGQNHKDVTIHWPAHFGGLSRAFEAETKPSGPRGEFAKIKSILFGKSEIKERKGPRKGGKKSVRHDRSGRGAVRARFGQFQESEN